MFNLNLDNHGGNAYIKYTSIGSNIRINDESKHLQVLTPNEYPLLPSENKNKFDRNIRKRLSKKVSFNK